MLFPLIQPSHIRAARPFDALTPEQRRNGLKQDARTGVFASLLEERADAADARRFTGEPITELGALS